MSISKTIGLIFLILVLAISECYVLSKDASACFHYDVDCTFFRRKCWCAICLVGYIKKEGNIRTKASEYIYHMGSCLFCLQLVDFDASVIKLGRKKENSMFRCYFFLEKMSQGPSLYSKLIIWDMLGTPAYKQRTEQKDTVSSAKQLSHGRRHQLQLTNLPTLDQRHPL